MHRQGFYNIKTHPPQFKGTKEESIRHFLSRFSKWAAQKRIEEERYVGAIGLCLHGYALDIFDKFVGGHNNASFQEVKDHLILSFDTESAFVARSKLVNRKFSVGTESISDYYRDLKRTSMRITTSPEEMVFYFIHGIKDSLLRALIVSRSPQSIDEAYEVAKRLEQVANWPSQSGSQDTALSRETKKQDRIRQEIADIKGSIAKVHAGINKIAKTEVNMQSEPETLYTPEKCHIVQEIVNPEDQHRYEPKYDFQPAYFNELEGKNEECLPQNPVSCENETFEDCAVREYIGKLKRKAEFRYKPFELDGSQGGMNKIQNHAQGPLQHDESERNKGECRHLLTNTATKASEYDVREMTIEVRINDVRIKALVDSGASLNVVRSDIVRKINPIITKSEIRDITGINNSRSKLHGTFTSEIKIKQCVAKAKLYIVQDSQYDLILGTPFLKKYAERLNFRTNVLTLKKDVGGCTKVRISEARGRRRIERAYAKTVSKVMVRPNSERQIKIYPSNNIIDKTLIFEENKLTRTKGLMAESQEVHGFTGSVKVWIKNKSRETVILRAGTRVGSLRIQNDHSPHICVLGLENDQNKDPGDINEHRVDSNNNGSNKIRKIGTTNNAGNTIPKGIRHISHKANDDSIAAGSQSGRVTKIRQTDTPVPKAQANCKPRACRNRYKDKVQDKKFTHKTPVRDNTIDTVTTTLHRCGYLVTTPHCINLRMRACQSGVNGRRHKKGNCTLQEEHLNKKRVSWEMGSSAQPEDNRSKHADNESRRLRGITLPMKTKNTEKPVQNRKFTSEIRNRSITRVTTPPPYNRSVRKRETQGSANYPNVVEQDYFQRAREVSDVMLGVKQAHRTKTLEEIKQYFSHNGKTSPIKASYHPLLRSNPITQHPREKLSPCARSTGIGYHIPLRGRCPRVKHISLGGVESVMSELGFRLSSEGIGWKTQVHKSITMKNVPEYLPMLTDSAVRTTTYRSRYKTTQGYDVDISRILRHHRIMANIKPPPLMQLPRVSTQWDAREDVTEPKLLTPKRCDRKCRLLEIVIIMLGVIAVILHVGIQLC